VAQVAEVLETALLRILLKESFNASRDLHEPALDALMELAFFVPLAFTSLGSSIDNLIQSSESN